MSLLFRIVFNSRTTSTHHKLALDALRHFRENGQEWRSLFLKYHADYLEGAKAPDKKFHDFRNHVIHTKENYWGGAIKAAQDWYSRLVIALKENKWKESVYSAGVLSHYYCDPLQPFHTGQTEEEGIIHRNWEWGASKLYEEFQNILIEDFGGYPDIERPSGENWLAEMIKQGSESANPFYDLMIDHYDANKGRKDPKSGFDQEIKDEVAQLVGHAAVGFSRILEKAFEDAGVEPPKINLTLSTLIRIMNIPKYWITRKLADRRERAIIDKMYKEFESKGKCIESLPPDDKTVRKLHAEQVLKTPIETLNEQPAKPTGTKHGQGKAPRKRSGKANLELNPPLSPVQTTEIRPTTPPIEEPVIKEEATIIPEQAPLTEATTEAPSTPIPKKSLKFHLELEDPVVDAPEIGKRTSRKLEELGIHTIKDLLEQDPEDVAKRLAHRRIKAETVLRWQQETKLAYRIPKIWGHDAKFLVGCGLTDPAKIAEENPEELLEQVLKFIKTREGKRVLRSGSKPDLEEVTNWINWAKHARD